MLTPEIKTRLIHAVDRHGRMQILMHEPPPKTDRERAMLEALERSEPIIFEHNAHNIYVSQIVFVNVIRISYHLIVVVDCEPINDIEFIKDILGNEKADQQTKRTDEKTELQAAQKSNGIGPHYIP